MRILKIGLLCCLIFGLFACVQSAIEGVRVGKLKTSEGSLYSVFYPDGLSTQVVASRPKAADNHCLLSVAAAYTDLQTNKPLDLLVLNGIVLQPKAKVGFLDGILTILGPTLTITKISRGDSPAQAQVEQLRRQKGTLLLQELLVFKRKNQRPAGGSIFQRRALVEFANHRFAVVESVSVAVTMQQFGDDLIELGAKNALYLDMGDWDEGWYKTSTNKVVSLGTRRSETARQSNWLIFARLPSPSKQR